MIHKPLEEITLTDLQALLDNAVAEMKTIEYKSLLPGESAQEKREFLADVSSFANTAGGDLIYGIKEKKGIPTDIPGVDIENTDDLKLKLENRIRDCIEPRVTCHIHLLQKDPGKHLVIIRVDKSWIGPHRVKSHGHFFARNSAGKYPLDTMDLRTAFTYSETLVEKIRNFRLDRTMKVVGQETPVPLPDGAKLIFHLMPMDAFAPGKNHPINDNLPLPPIGATSMEKGFNLDGFYYHAEEEGDYYWGYSQFFRNGIVEAVDWKLLNHDPDEKIAFADEIETDLIKALKLYMRFFEKSSITLPAYIFLTITKSKGYALRNRKNYLFNLRLQAKRVDRNILFLPEVEINNYKTDSSLMLKPIFDLMWNAFGFDRCQNYEGSQYIFN